MTDEEAIKRTVLDYFEGWFEGDAARMERALHPRFAKRSPGENGLDEDSARTMIEATRGGLGKRRDPGERGTDVQVVEIHGAIATVVVHSNVYREYLHVARTDGGWKLVNALWSFE
jgi:Putative lumazine-binding